MRLIKILRNQLASARISRQYYISSDLTRSYMYMKLLVSVIIGKSHDKTFVLS